MVQDYIKWIRSKVGHEKIFLNFAGGILVNKNNEILLQRRADKGTWGLIGGAMELGESAVETLKREFKEETGLDIQVKSLLGVYTKYTDSYPNGDEAQTLLVLYLVGITDGSFITGYTSDETLELGFFSLSDLEKMPLVNKQHQDMINDFFSGKYDINS